MKFLSCSILCSLVNRASFDCFYAFSSFTYISIKTLVMYIVYFPTETLRERSEKVNQEQQTSNDNKNGNK